jgi:hypothetical protein
MSGDTGRETPHDHATKLFVDLTRITDTSRCSPSEIVNSLQRQLDYWLLKEKEAERLPR